MTTPINAPLTSDIWHLSIDDLLAPISEPPRLGGPGPFVINLSASTAPLSPPAKELVPSPGAFIYQIQRVEDRRPRYRLRLGPFLTEDEADAMLRIVRDVYPSALTATAESDDLRAIAACKPRSESAPPPTSRAPVAPAIAASAKDANAQGASPGSVPPATRPVARPHPVPKAVSIPVLSDFVEPAPRTTAPPPSSSRRASARAPVAAQATVNPAATVAQPRVIPVTPVLAPAAHAAVPHARPPSLESTQTLRPLTTSELDAAAPRWYVIQLSLSSEIFDPESLPNLDIFDEYRLYSVTGLDQGRIVHALRLGFFAEEGAAAAVASYLAGFYDKPTVKRISLAERERFRDHRVQARKDIGATGRHAVIEITGERHVRDRRPRIATARPAAPAAVLPPPTSTPERKR